MAVVYKPHEAQVAAHRAFLVDGYNRGVLFWGRQVGKTMWSVYHAWMSAILKQGTYFVVFKTYTQANQVVWKQYLHTIPRELIAGKPNSDELSITLKHIHGPVALPGIGWTRVDHDDDLPPSRIRLLGSDQADLHRGATNVQGIVFDEYADQNPDNWTSVYQPMFATTNGWAIFMGTPKGYNHFYDLVEEAQDNPKTYFFSKATWRDNPSYSKEAYLEAKADADRKGQIDAFMQEYELAFRTVQGSVYREFSREVHVVEPDQVPESGTDFVTWDFGYVEGHPNAVNFVRVDDQGNWYIYDEIHAVETELDDIIYMYRQKATGTRITAIIADSARPDLIKYMQNKGLPVVPSTKNSTGTNSSIASGIVLLHQLLKPRLQLAGPPKPSLYVTKNCKFTILDFEQYKYPEVKKDRPVNELPVKMFDDHMDGLRYLALHLKFGLNKSQASPKKAIQFGDYGMPL